MEYRRGLAMRFLSVCQSVCPSVKRVDCDKTEEKSVQIFIPCERSFSLVFSEEEWLVVATPSTWNVGPTGPRWSEIADFEPIIARSASAVTTSEKIQLTLMGSPLRAFQWAKDDNRMLPLSPPQGGSKPQKCRFPSKIALRLKKDCYKVSFCKKTVRLTTGAFSVAGPRHYNTLPPWLQQAGSRATFCGKLKTHFLQRVRIARNAERCTS